jgi:GMP synthase-like glutamine amidotransferase
MKKVALLVCDHVAEDLAVKFGDYPQMFSELLPDFQLAPFFVVDGVFPKRVSDYDAYLCTGSRASVYDKEEWIGQLKLFVREIKKANKKFVGVCFGHQMLAEALGGMVEKSNKGWCVGVHTFEIIEKASWMVPAQDELNLLMMCQDQVVRLPEGAKVLGLGAKCDIGIFTVGEHMLGIQAHPEFSKEYDQTLMERRVDRMGEELVKTGLESLEKVVHQALIAKWIKNFIC